MVLQNFIYVSFIHSQVKVSVKYQRYFDIEIIVFDLCSENYAYFYAYNYA